MRMTNHYARIKNAKAKHNDRDGIKSTHIDEEKSRFNRYWNRYDGAYSGATQKAHMNHTEAEKRTYKELFQEHINDVSNRAEKSHHRDRKTSVEKMLSGTQTQPQDLIFQMGSTRDKSANDNDLALVWKRYVKWHEQTFPQCTFMSYAVHLDEAHPHVHLRSVYWWKDENGIKHPGQERALEQMGVELPEPDKPRGRHNNRKTTHTKLTTEKLRSLCEEMGYQIDREPLKQKHNLPKEEAIVQELKKDKEKAERELAAIREKLLANKNLAKLYNQAIKEVEEEMERQRERSKNRSREIER